MQPVSPSVYYMLHVFLQTLHLHMALLHIYCTHERTILLAKNTWSDAFQNKVSQKASHNRATYLMDLLSPWENSYEAFEWFWNRGLVLLEQPTQQSNETTIHLFLHPHSADIRTAVVMSCNTECFCIDLIKPRACCLAPHFLSSHWGCSPQSFFPLFLPLNS